MARATKALGFMISGFEVSEEMWYFYEYLKEIEMTSRNAHIRKLMTADMKAHKALNGKKFEQWAKKRKALGV